MILKSIFSDYAVSNEQESERKYLRVRAPPGGTFVSNGGSLFVNPAVSKGGVTCVATTAMAIALLGALWV